MWSNLLVLFIFLFPHTSTFPISSTAEESPLSVEVGYFGDTYAVSVPTTTLPPPPTHVRLKPGSKRQRLNPQQQQRLRPSHRPPDIQPFAPFHGQSPSLSFPTNNAQSTVVQPSDATRLQQQKDSFLAFLKSFPSTPHPSDTLPQNSLLFNAHPHFILPSTNFNRQHEIQNSTAHVTTTEPSTTRKPTQPTTTTTISSRWTTASPILPPAELRLSPAFSDNEPLGLPYEPPPVPEVLSAADLESPHSMYNSDFSSDGVVASADRTSIIEEAGVRVSESLLNDPGDAAVLGAFVHSDTHQPRESAQGSAGSEMYALTGNEMSVLSQRGSQTSFGIAADTYSTTVAPIPTSTGSRGESDTINVLSVRNSNPRKRPSGSRKDDAFQEWSVWDKSQNHDIAATNNTEAVAPLKKFGYLIHGDQQRKFRTEERTPDGLISGLFGFHNNNNGDFRGVQYTADPSSINPKTLLDALYKFLSL